MHESFWLVELFLDICSAAWVLLKLDLKCNVWLRCSRGVLMNIAFHVEFDLCLGWCCRICLKDIGENWRTTMETNLLHVVWPESYQAMTLSFNFDYVRIISESMQSVCRDCRFFFRNSIREISLRCKLNKSQKQYQLHRQYTHIVSIRRYKEWSRRHGSSKNENSVWWVDLIVEWPVRIYT